jgi:hypothetical protein
MMSNIPHRICSCKIICMLLETQAHMASIYHMKTLEEQLPITMSDLL